MEMYSVLLEALPPTVHHHLSTHTHTDNHMAAEERKESGAANPASTHQSNNSTVKPICWDKAAKETLLRRVEESGRGTVFKITTNEECFNVMCKETMLFLFSQVKARKAFSLSALWVYMQWNVSGCCDEIPLLPHSLSGANHSRHSEVKHDGSWITKLRTITNQTLLPRICNKNLFFCRLEKDGCCTFHFMSLSFCTGDAAP